MSGKAAPVIRRRICYDCRYYRRASSGFFRHSANHLCHRSMKLEVDLVSGSLVDKGLPLDCEIERKTPSAIAALMGRCGVKGRYWREIPEDPTPPEGFSPVATP